MPQGPFQLSTPEVAILLDPPGAGSGQRDALLRRWAWWRGRTDVILDLDVLTAVIAAQKAPSAGAFVALAAVLPDEWLDARERHELRGLPFDPAGAAADPSGGLVEALGALRVAVELRIEGYFAAMRDDAAAGELVADIPPTIA